MLTFSQILYLNTFQTFLWYIAMAIYLNITQGTDSVCTRIFLDPILMTALHVVDVSGAGVIIFAPPNYNLMKRWHGIRPHQTQQISKLVSVLVHSVHQILHFLSKLFYSVFQWPIKRPSRPAGGPNTLRPHPIKSPHPTQNRVMGQRITHWIV